MYTEQYIQFAFMGPGQIIVILLILLLLFGAKRIPDLMKGLGKGIKEYKKAMKGVEDELFEGDTPNEKEPNKD